MAELEPSKLVTRVRFPSPAPPTSLVVRLAASAPLPYRRRARAVFRVAVSGRREQEPSFFTVIVWRDQAEHASKSLSRGSRVVVVGRLQQRTWTAEDGGARSTVEVLAEELGPSLRWATATTTRATRSQDQ
jgi:single stranded DNA-binding protein